MNRNTLSKLAMHICSIEILYIIVHYGYMSGHWCDRDQDVRVGEVESKLSYYCLYHGKNH